MRATCHNGGRRMVRRHDSPDDVEWNAAVAVLGALGSDIVSLIDAVNNGEGRIEKMRLIIELS